MRDDGSVSAYFFDIDDNLLFLPTAIYLWNAETREERAVSSGEYARIQNELGRIGTWQAWAIRGESFRDFRDPSDGSEPTFLVELRAAITGPGRWQGPSWPLLVHAAANQRPIALVTARGHEPATIEAGLRLLVEHGQLPRMPVILGIYTATNPTVRRQLGVEDPATTVPSVKKLAIQQSVERILEKYGAAPPHRFGMSDDDPNNLVLAISAMRDCKVKHRDKRFFVINTNHQEFVKLEIFPMEHPATAPPELGTAIPESVGLFHGGNASIYVTDMDRSVAFYSETLGLRLRGRLAGWAELDAGNGLVLGLHPAHPPDSPVAGTPGAINIELAVTRTLEEVRDTLAARGARFAGEIVRYGDVKLVSLLDPDNNVVILAEVLHQVGTP